MLTIRMQRTGRSGHAQYRVIVQDSRFTPTSGRVVAYLGNYNPHTKEATLDGEKASNYLNNGAQPSDRVARLLKAQGIKLPEWVAQPAKKERSIRNVEKLRRNRPAKPVSETPIAEESTVVVDEQPTETESPESPDVAAEESVTEEVATEPVEPAAEPEPVSPAKLAEEPAPSEPEVTKE